MKNLLIAFMMVCSLQTYAADNDASPLTRRAKSLGFEGYSWLSSLNLDYKKMGGKKLTHIMILVDGDCGANFEAIQRIGKYVLFAPLALRNSSCSGHERVVVLPAQGVQFKRGEYIDSNSYYVFIGVLKGKSEDGFPTEALAIKQVK
jgi:hypothetical protein